MQWIYSPLKASEEQKIVQMGRKFPEGIEINPVHFETFGLESQCLRGLPGTPGSASCCPQFASRGTGAVFTAAAASSFCTLCIAAGRKGIVGGASGMKEL